VPTAPPLRALDWPDVLSWFVTYQGWPVDVTLSTYPGGVLLDGPAILYAEDARPGKVPTILRLQLGGFALYLAEQHVSDPILESGTDHLTLGLPGNVAVELCPLR